MMTESVIKLEPSSRPNILHYGRDAGYERFKGACFIEDCLSSSPVKDYIIVNVVYATDSLYQAHDGYYGRCWLIDIQDVKNDKLVTYYIRNWVDLVDHYAKQGLKFSGS